MDPTGAVEQTIDGADLGRQPSHSRTIGNVESPVLTSLQCPQRIGIDVGGDNLGTGSDELFRRCAPDALGGSRDENAFTSKARHGGVQCYIYELPVQN